MEVEMEVLVCFGKRRIVKLATPSLEALQACAFQSFRDVLPPHTGESPSLLFQIQDENWEGLLIDIHKTQVIPNKSIIKMILESEGVPSSELSVKDSLSDSAHVCIQNYIKYTL